MTAVKFEKPNFTCKVAHVSDPSKWRPRILYAATAEAAIEYLKGRGFIIHEDGIEPYDFDAVWLKKASDEQVKANTDFPVKENEYKWKNAIWKELKDHLQDIFSYKCAYCDADFRHVSWGDVEHYRPKGAVTDADGNPVEHSGYYWLAYDPSNYLPSCSLCNSGDGKQNRFPIKGQYASKPGDNLEDEEPLLLNPYFIDFREHLKFGTSGDINPGFASGKDEAGKVSIKVYDLNRMGLPEKRKEEQQHAKTEYSQALVLKISTEGAINNVDKVIMRYQSREKPFSVAVLEELTEFARKIDVSLPGN